MSFLAGFGTAVLVFVIILMVGFGAFVAGLVNRL